MTKDAFGIDAFNVHRFETPLGRSCPFAFSPDGAHLAAGGPWGVACVEASTARVVFTREDLGDVRAVAWSAPERMLAFSKSNECDVKVTAMGVPDGGTDGERTLANVSGGGVRVSVSADSAVALVAPSVWRKGSDNCGYVLSLATLEVLKEVSPLKVIGRAGYGAPHALAALSPDGASIALVYGGGDVSPLARTEDDDRGMAVLWRWSNGEMHTLMAGGVGAVLDVQWLGAETVAVLRSGTRIVTEPAGASAYFRTVPRLLVLSRGRTSAVTDSDRWPDLNLEGFTAGEQGIGDFPMAVLHEDRERLMVVGFNQQNRGEGVLRVLSAQSGETKHLRTMPARPFEGFSAQWLGDDILALGVTGGGELYLFRVMLEGPPVRILGRVAAMAQGGVGARVWHCGEWVAVTWVEGSGRALSGRLAWLQHKDVAARRVGA